MSKLFILPVVFFCASQVLFGQQMVSDSTGPLYATSVKINFNGLRLGIEQKIYKNISLQLEGFYWGSDYVKVNPQIRYYLKGKNSSAFFGVGYYYKHQEYGVADSVRKKGTVPYFSRDFYISKWIHALTLNAGFFYDTRLFKWPARMEFNGGLGIRFKKSNRYGVAADEEINFSEAFILRPQHEQDTGGKFAPYPELNLMLSLVLPLKR